MGYSIISIHAPTRGATGPKGRDRSALEISIHAPTRGATGSPDAAAVKAMNFNPRSHKGSDGKDLCFCRFHKAFQSTLPQGERQFLTLCQFLPYDFNPRSHKGSDTLHRANRSEFLNFNPRSHKGSDGNRLWSTKIYKHFNPRSHKGSDQGHPADA